MAFLWKPVSENNGKLVVLTPDDYNGKLKDVTLVGPNGSILGKGKYTGIANGDRGHWRFDRPGGAYPPGTRVVMNYENGGGAYYTIRNTGGRNEIGGLGSPFKDFSELTSGSGDDTLNNDIAYAPGGGGVFGGGEMGFGQSFGDNSGYIPPGAIGGGSSGVSSLPFYYGQNYPTFKPVDFDPVKFPSIEKAPYNFTDPQKFAETFGTFNRQELGKNFKQSQGFALDALNTELQGLQSFVPAAAALKRQELSIDNQFNQQQRTQQVNQALPNAGADLEAQRQRAVKYASGQLPDDQLDRALELGVRGAAADQGTFAGFGAQGAQTRKISDLMSAGERFQIGQYGENLTGQNIQQNAGLFLAPTSYSDAGAQVRVTPEVGAGRLTYQGFGAVNEATLLSPGQALNSVVQQNQFDTGLEQQTRMFNADGSFRADTFNSEGELKKDMYNSSSTFTAELGKFQYDVGYLAQLQAANQHNLDAAFTLGMAGVTSGAFGEGFDNQETSNAIGDIAEASGSAIGAISGSGGSSVDTSQQNDRIDVSAETVGATQVDSSTGGETSRGVFDTSSTQPSAAPASANAQIASEQPALGTQATPPTGYDGSISSAVRYSQATPTPQGYTKVANNKDGTYSAVRNVDYSQDLERFAKYSGGQTTPIQIQNIAAADRKIANSAGISFVQTQGFQPISLLPNGKQVYSLPAAANNADNTMGQKKLNRVGQEMAYLGAGDRATQEYIGRFSRDVSNPEVLNKFDETHEEGGSEALTKEIVKKFLDKSPDMNTAEGQQFVAGAMRISELWDNFSPAQKSLALTSLTDSATKIKTGRRIGEQIVRGTENSSTPLRVSDVSAIKSRGGNGDSVARNWNQLSAVSRIIAGVGSPDQVAAVATQIGLTGYGPQGASVPVNTRKLAEIGASPVPEFGIGALAINADKELPRGYVAVSKTPEGKVIAMPKLMAQSTTLGPNAIQPLVYRKAKEIAAGSHPAQKLWGKSPTQGIVRGAAGGSAMISGLQTMAKQNPYMFSGVAAYSLFENTLRRR